MEQLIKCNYFWDHPDMPPDYNETVSWFLVYLTGLYTKPPGRKKTNLQGNNFFFFYSDFLLLSHIFQRDFDMLQSVNHMGKTNKFLQSFWVQMHY